jgi:RNA polymerase sigma-70 factor (ECF subfamily)
MDTDGFERLLAACEDDLYSFCRYLAGHCLAADLYQDTVLAAFEMRGRINTNQNPKALLISIAVGKWKNLRRKTGRRQAKVPEMPLTGYGAEPKTPPEHDPQEQVQSVFVKKAIQDALGQLDDKFRIPLILHYFVEWDLKTVAGICGIPKGTVKSRLFKGRILLKDALEKEGIHG